MNSFWSVTLFWAAAAAAVALALAFVLPFLMRSSTVERRQAARRDINLAVYRDQMKDLNNELSNTQLTPEQFLASKLELETRAAEDALAQEERVAAPVASRRLGFALALVLPVAAIGLYAWLGNPNALTAMAGGQPNAELSAQPTEADLLQMIERMEARAQANPNDADIWEAMITANAMVGRWPEALKAAEKSLALSPNKPAVMTAYAEALAMSTDMVMAGEPIAMVNKALQADPNDPKGLELAGIHAFQNEQYAEAVAFLDRLQRLMPPDTFYAQEILRMRNEAQRLAGLSNGPAGPAASAASVGGSVEVAPALKAQLNAQSTIYLIARAGEGGPPVAAARVALGAFPFQFRLDDSMAMSPDNTLSKHKEVVLLARISASGNPIAQPGDMEGRLVGVAVGSQDVKLVIDRVLP